MICTLALAAYNAGRGSVNRWIDEAEATGDEPIIQYKETQDYVVKVTEAMKVYDTLY